MSYDGSEKDRLLESMSGPQRYGGAEDVSSFESRFCYFESNGLYDAHYIYSSSYSISFLFKRLSEVELEDCHKERNLRVLKQKLSFLAVRIQPAWRVGEDRDPSQRAKARELLSNIIRAIVKSCVLAFKRRMLI